MTRAATFSKMMAFEYWISLGPGRSLRATAAHFSIGYERMKQVSASEDWAGRLKELERKAERKMMTDLIHTRAINGQSAKGVAARQKLQNKELVFEPTTPWVESNE